MLTAIEIGHGAAGGFAGMMLAALGGEVTRVVTPADVEHEASEGGRGRYRSAYFHRAKQRLELDLDAPGDLERLREQLTSVDVLIDTLPPSGLAETGLAVADLHERHPGLVIVSITPFGQDGPRAHWQATDLIVQAMGGLLASSGEDESPPSRLAGEQAAHVAGTMGALQALAALRGVREGVSTGVHIDVSEQEVLSTGWSREIGRYTHTGEGLARAARRTGVQGYPHTEMASDGYVFLFSQGKSWEGVAAILGLYEFLTDEWLDPAARVERWDEIEPHFRATVASRSRYDWFAAAAEQGFTFAPVEDARSILDSPQLAAREFFEEIEVDGKVVRVPSLPFTFATLDHPRRED